MVEVTPRGLLDTSVVIAHTKEELEATLPTEVAISVATLAELHYGPPGRRGVLTDPRPP